MLYNLNMTFCTLTPTLRITKWPDTWQYSGKAISVGSYNVVDSEFATIVAEDNAAERAARETNDGNEQ